MKPYTRVYAEIDLDAIEWNIKEIRRHRKPETGVYGVVKSDGYGHGSVPVAAVLEPEVCGYAVASIEEGILLRHHGMKKPILVLGVTHPSHYEELIRYDIRPTMFQLEKVRQLSETAVFLGKTVKIHVAVDTGMSRIGLGTGEKEADLILQMSQLPSLEIEGMFTHFACADEGEREITSQALLKFQTLIGMLEKRGLHIPIRHCANSAAILDFPDADFDAVRAGIALYGLYPSDQVSKEQIHLRPALSLKSFISYKKTIPVGTPVSYGGMFVSDREMTIATIPIGYGDGYPRNLSNKGEVLICGKRARILGRVCMDQMMVDITHIPEAEEEDEVTLIGRDGREEITVEELAETGGGFHYEILCGLGKRVPRVYLRHGKAVGQKDYFADHYPGSFC